MCVDAGGSITGEHGVGREKQCEMSYMFAEPDLATMQRVRRAFDPATIANPDKLFPTPRLCGERKPTVPTRRMPLKQPASRRFFDDKFLRRSVGAEQRAQAQEATTNVFPGEHGRSVRSRLRDSSCSRLKLTVNVRKVVEPSRGAIRSSQTCASTPDAAPRRARALVAGPHGDRGRRHKLGRSAASACEARAAGCAGSALRQSSLQSAASSPPTTAACCA